MKTAKFFLLIITLAALNGCALFTPPPFNNSYTEITRDANGNIVSSTYYRRVIGFTYGDKESAASWSNADRLVRTNESGKIASAGEFEGIILSRSSRTAVTIKIEGNGLKREYNLEPGEELSASLPAGTYTSSSYISGKKRGRSFTFTVGPNTKRNYSGKEAYWRTSYNDG